MPPSLFSRRSACAPSASPEILRITDNANALKRAGRPVIVLGAGEPDFDTPQNVREAAVRAMGRGDTRYTVLDGSPAMKAAVQLKFKRDNALDFALDEISVSAGAKQVIFNALMASLNPGDEVILPAPYWTSYADIVQICGGVPVPVACTEENRLPARRRAARSGHHAAHALAVPELAVEPDRRGLQRSAARSRCARCCCAIRKCGCWRTTSTNTSSTTAWRSPRRVAVEPRLRERTLTINGVSKAYAMTGWRVGYGAGPRALIAAMAVVQSQTTSCPSSISQAAAIEALTGPQDVVADAPRRFPGAARLRGRRAEPRAGPALPRAGRRVLYLRELRRRARQRTRGGALLQTDSDFCRYLLQDFEVAVVPGSVFGLAPYFRISYATSMAQLEEACARIIAACAALE